MEKRTSFFRGSLVSGQQPVHQAFLCTKFKEHQVVCPPNQTNKTNRNRVYLTSDAEPVHRIGLFKGKLQCEIDEIENRERHGARGKNVILNMEFNNAHSLSVIPD